VAGVSKFLRDESGATVVEYALIAAGISLAIAASLNGLIAKFSAMFDLIVDALK